MSRAPRGKAALPPGRDVPKFTEVSTAKTRWDYFSAGVLTQASLVLLAIWVPILIVRAAPPTVKYNSVPLIAAPLTSYVPPAPKAPPQKFLEAIKPAQPVVARQPVKPALAFEPRIIAPKEIRSPRANPEAPVVKNSFESPMEMRAAAPVVRRPVETGVLQSSGSSAAPTLTNRPVSQVQTGGFGDPNGVPAAKGQPTRAVNINTLGSFDLPAGPGVGNGTGGASGARGTVASAGFGNGVATAAPEQPQRRAVQSTGFGDVAPAAQGEARQRTVAVSRTPVEILAKPNPAYTQEARSRKIEGEVKLRVIFLASGQLQILGVTQGLGYGLDEAAIAAAQKIRFRPAREGDRAVDAPAVITIEFKLAY
jgi:TonB family protein